MKEKEIRIHDTALLGGLMCLGYRPEKLDKNGDNSRIEFVFKQSKKLEKDIEGVKNGVVKFPAHELALELHSVRSRIKTFTNNNN